MGQHWLKAGRPGMASLQNPQKSSEIQLQTLDQRSQSHCETPQTNKNVPAPLSLPLFPCSDSKGVESLGSKLGKRSREQRNFTFSQTWTLWDWEFCWIEVGFANWSHLRNCCFPMTSQEIWGLDQIFKLWLEKKVFHKINVKGQWEAQISVDVFEVHPKILVRLMYYLHS